VYIRCTKDRDDLLSLVDTAIQDVQQLLHYENRRLIEITPKPSALFAMLEAKRGEVNAEALNRREPKPDSSLPRPPLAHRAATGASSGARLAAEERAEPWWAWEVSEDEALDGNAEGLACGPRESRRAERKPVHCFVLLEPGGIRATLGNLSTGGLLLHARRLRPPGSRVRLILSTTEGPLQAEGVVRWVQKGAQPRDASDSTGMGIEFTRCSPELRSYLNSRFPPPMDSVTPGAPTPCSATP
jgi:hypothetical protein